MRRFTTTLQALVLLLSLLIGSWGQMTTETPIIPEQEVFPPGDNYIDPVIVMGERAQPGEIPFHAYLVENRTDGFYQCGGSLIHPIWVLTAAHCISAEGASTVVLLGGTDRTNMSYIQRANLRIVHEDYNITPIENDVGLLRLPFPATGPEISPVALANHDLGLLEGVLLRASGYGNIQNGGPSSQHLLKVQLQGISNDECRMSFGDVIKNSTLCANWSMQEGQSVCQGDSGGPLALIENGQTTLVGVVSFTASRSRGGCEANIPQGFARVSSFRSWIEENMNRNAV